MHRVRRFHNGVQVWPNLLGIFLSQLVRSTEMVFVIREVPGSPPVVFEDAEMVDDVFANPNLGFFLIFGSPEGTVKVIGDGAGSSNEGVLGLLAEGLKPLSFLDIL